MKEKCNHLFMHTPLSQKAVASITGNNTSLNRQEDVAKPQRNNMQVRQIQNIAEIIFSLVNGIMAHQFQVSKTKCFCMEKTIPRSNRKKYPFNKY